MCIKSITTYTLNYKINVLSIPPLKEWAFRTCLVILSILRNEMKKDDIIFVHNSIKKFIKNYYNVACVYNGRNILKELFLDVDYSLNIYKLDFATNDFAYYSNIDGEMIMINILDGSILGTIYPFIEGAIYDSIENIKNGKEQLIYGDYKPFEDALDMD